LATIHGLYVSATYVSYGLGEDVVKKYKVYHSFSIQM